MSSALWLASRTGLFCALKRWSRSCTSSMDSLSIALNGSSRISTSGSSMNACAKPSRWRWPSEYFQTGFFSSGSSPSSIMARRVRSLSALPDIAARSMRFCRPVSCGRKPGVSMITPVFGAKSDTRLMMPASALASSGFRLSADLPPIRQPLTTTYPDVGWEKPQMQRMSVVLPQPFAPTRP